MSKDTLKKRYFYKLSTNFVGLFINLFTEAIIPRALGVISYGDFNFTTTIITQFLNLFEFRTSTCFYTKLAQRPKENKLILFYSAVTLLIFLVLIVSVVGITFSPFRQFVFQGQSWVIIIYVLFLVMLNWILDLFVKIMDAHGATVPLEKMRLANRVLGILLLVLLYFSNHLNLDNYFYYQYLLIILLLFFLYRYLKKHGYLLFGSTLSRGEFASYFKEFYRYSGPLGLYVVLQFISICYDRWMLQHYGGSYQQGIYSFSYSISNFCFLFVVAMIPLFTRELSVAAGKSDIARMGELYRLYVPMLYAVTAYFCCFIFVESKACIALFGGEEYSSANLTLKILAFQPLVSVYSNLNGSVIYANGRTNLFLKLSLFFTPLGMLVTYLALTNSLWGFNFGATGLAMKGVGLELVTVIIILFVNTKFLKLSFRNYLMHMIFSVLPFLFFAYSSHAITQLLFQMLNVSSNIIVSFFLAGALYSFFALLVVWFYPKVFGFSRNEIAGQINNIRQMLPK